MKKENEEKKTPKKHTQKRGHGGCHCHIVGVVVCP